MGTITLSREFTKRTEFVLAALEISDLMNIGDLIDQTQRNGFEPCLRRSQIEYPPLPNYFQCWFHYCPSQARQITFSQEINRLNQPCNNGRYFSFLHMWTQLSIRVWPVSSIWKCGDNLRVVSINLAQLQIGATIRGWRLIEIRYFYFEGYQVRDWKFLFITYSLYK